MLSEQGNCQKRDDFLADPGMEGGTELEPKGELGKATGGGAFISSSLSEVLRQLGMESHNG